MRDLLCCNSARIIQLLTNLSACLKRQSSAKLRFSAQTRHAVLAVIALAIFSSTLIYTFRSSAQQFDIQPLADGRVGVDYRVALVVNGGTGVKHWQVVDGAVPGISLSDDGTLSGRPTVARPEPYIFTVEATDSSNPPQKYQMKLSMVITSSMYIVPPSQVAAGPGAVASPTATPSPAATPRAESNADKVSIGVSEEMEGLKNYFKEDSSALKTDQDENPIAHDLIQKTLGNREGQHFEKGLYCVIHAVKWTKRLDKFESDDHWYLFINEPNNGAPAWVMAPLAASYRLLGVKQVAVLLIHLGVSSKWDIKYDVSVTEKTPQNVTNLMTLLGVVAGPGSEKVEKPINVWGGKVLTNLPGTSEIAFSGKVTFLQGDKQSQDAQSFAKTYTNEGRSLWDVSVGFQLKATKELQYNADDGIVRTKNADRQNAFGMLNFYPWKVDVRGDEHNLLRTTHFFVGVPISGKPLDNPIAGMGWGIYKTPLKVNFFAGITFTRVRDPNSLGAGQKATQSQLQSDFREHRVHKFIFGVDFPISQIKDALKKK